MDNNQLEIILRKWKTESGIEKILSVNTEAAIPKGENYLSVISRLKLKVVLGNGRLSTKSLILKSAIKDEMTAELLKEMGTFKMEMTMYSLILKEYEHIMNEFGDTNDLMWCQLYHVEPFSCFILEDLKASGFKLADRLVPLDLEHASLVLWNLGRFHGLSKILEQRGMLSRMDFKPYSYTVNQTIQECFLYHGLNVLSRAMEESWGPTWHTIAQHIKMPLETVKKRMAELGTFDDTKFNVLNHGDCWCCNIMFKYDWQNRPTSLRFIDFQEPHYSTPGWDIHFFLSNSVNSEVRRNHFDYLIETYTKSLISTLKFYDYNGKIPSLEDIKEEMERLALFGFMMLGVMHPCMTSKEKDAINIEEIITSNGAGGYNMDIFRSEKLRDQIGPDVIIAVEKGII